MQILGLSYMRMMQLFGHIDPPKLADEIDYLLQPVKDRLATMPEAERARVARQLVAMMDAVLA